MKIIKYVKLLKKCNTLELENERLKDIIKNKLYEQFKEDLTLKEQVEDLKKENQRYREKIKEIKNENIKLR